MNQGAIFLDRDGTINELAAPHQYITTREDFRFLPGALDALAFLAKNSERRIVIVTNQAGVCKGAFADWQLKSEYLLSDLHTWMVEQIKVGGGRIDDIFACPHLPGDDCPCRKPKPGMLLHAAQIHNLDLSRSVLVGDTKTDLQAAWAAGVPECYMVLTGVEHKEFPRNQGFTQAYDIVATLMDAARLIVLKERNERH